MNTADENQTGDQSVNDGPTIGLEDAYGLQTPEDNRRLYEQWAATYDTDFLERHRYVYHREVVNALARYGTLPALDPILDVGCGTGVAGSTLRELGAREIDGLDISPEMLAQAGQRLDQQAEPVYRNLTVADLTQPLPIKSRTYGGVVSVGTFTHGHVGPEALDELIRIVLPNGVLCLGVNGAFYEVSGFESVVLAHVDQGRLARWHKTEAQMYENPPDGHEDDTAVALTLVLPD